MDRYELPFTTQSELEIILRRSFLTWTWRLNKDLHDSSLFSSMYMYSKDIITELSSGLKPEVIWGFPGDKTHFVQS